MSLYEKICNFDSSFNYEKIENIFAENSSCFKVGVNFNEKYFLKIIDLDNFERFKLKISFLEFLNKNNFNTSKLLFSKFEDNKCFMIFEFREDFERNIDFKNEKLLFYEHIKNFYLLSCEFEKKNKSLMNNFLEKSFFLEYINIFKKNFENNIFHKKILTEINMYFTNQEFKPFFCLYDFVVSNFFVVNGKVFQIDFDEMIYLELEFDLVNLFKEMYFEGNLFENFEVFKREVEDNLGFIVDCKKFYYYLLFLFYFLFFKNKDLKFMYKTLDIIKLKKKFIQ